jgi:flagellar hook-associated protein 2
MSSSITSPITVSGPGFTGVSKFASGLQQVLNRAVGIASLPLNSLQAGLTTLNNRQAALQNLDATFSGLQQSIGQLQNTVQSGLLTTSISNGSVVAASVASTATQGTYSIEVDNLGSSSTALSNAGASAVTDSLKQGITDSAYVNLSVGTTTIQITPASSSLQDLASAVNSQSNGQVQATLVNVGSSATPDYRLSLTSTKLGTDALDLTDSSGIDLISSSTPGALASYKIDGAPAITSDSRTITLSPGLTVSLLGQSTNGQPTTITVHHDAATLASAFNLFAQYYNNAVNTLSAQHGQSAGALQGDSLVQVLHNVLSQLGTYSNGTPEGALANFGITLDQTGQLSVNTSAFTTAANASFSTLLSTLGTSSSSGFLATATNLLKGIEEATTGNLPSEEKTVADEITAQNRKLAAEQATVTQLQTNLTAQISKADSAIATLESQVTYVTGLFATYTGATSTQSNGLQSL